jgi:hypothetical protein
MAAIGVHHNDVVVAAIRAFALKLDPMPVREKAGL